MLGKFQDLLVPVLKAVDPVREALGIDQNKYLHVAEALGIEKNTYTQVGADNTGLVFDYGANELAVDTERIPGPLLDLGVETLATPPIELTASVPESFTEEDIKEKKPFKVRGPHGPIEVKPPDGAVRGGAVTLRLVPRPEFRIEVPPEARPGLCFNVKRADGVEVQVPVPPNLKPGDKFEVLPPAMMVRVPEGIEAGAYVLFRHTVVANRAEGTEVIEWCRVQVPEGVRSGQYFAARLPLPGKPSKNVHPQNIKPSASVKSPASKEFHMEDDNKDDKYLGAERDSGRDCRDVGR
jgi:hypothetical protein